MNGCLFKPLERAQLLQVITGAPMNPTRDDTLLTLENLAANNPQAWRDLVTTARQQNSYDLAQLTQAVAANNFASARHAAHQLLGSARMLRADALQHRCRAAEQAAEHQDSALLQQLLPEVAGAVAELDALFLRALETPIPEEVI